MKYSVYYRKGKKLFEIFCSGEMVAKKIFESKYPKEKITSVEIDMIDFRERIKRNYQLKTEEANKFIAERTGYSLSGVRKWFSDPRSKSYRKIPRRILKYLEMIF